MNITKEDLDKVALSEEEYGLIIQGLGREPTEVELGILGSLWSEHCGYKHSKPLLKLLPSKSKRVMVEPGEENAGVVDIGDGLVVVMKMESHNHPSAVEPFQGAATGIGGIVRDIFTMGARPIALMNSLCFGPLSQVHNRYLCNGVVDGIAAYGNCLGIPNVGGEISFSECYSTNPLVNVLCLGIAHEGELVSSSAGGEGNLLMLAGADTGRDGIYGASGLASRTFGGDQELRPTVQVGNPFLEKLLIEACLELARTDWIVGMQDLGAAGLTSSAIESAAKGGCGLDLDVLKVPRREENMTPYEVMLSESQERMLLIVKKGYQDRVKALFDHWEVPSVVIGQVTGDGMAVIREGEEITAEVPVSLLSSPPLYRPRARKPSWLGEVQSFDARSVPDLKPRQCNPTLLQLLSSPNIASKEAVYRQYDHQVMNNSVVLPGSDAAVLRVKGTRKGLALTTDSNGKYCYLDPFVGGVIVVAEAARNLVCSGAEPMAITDCLNFGDPEKKEVYYQLRECVKGIARACRELQLPVISGNVSLYNEARDGAIYPTPVIGMVGLLDDVSTCCTTSFKDEGDLVFLLGEVLSRDEGRDGLGGSEYLEMSHGLVRGRPSIDLALERRVQRCLLEAIRAGLVKSAHDCSHGGLAVTIAESCIAGNIGFRGGISCRLEEQPEGETKATSADVRLDSVLFGERQSRIVISLTRSALVKLSRITRKWRVPLAFLGEVGGQYLVVEGYLDLPLARAKKSWKGGLPRALSGNA
ncbi:MAG: phosphoribosylformylglycinamidine synthase subunit PurL [Dehalococcoidia bacterium]|nr:phosphoribosylformylglycinamidine synthase subunit PurL [Dehalococcoidia bacterium]